MSPPAGRFLSARWVHLAMLNYEVDPAILGNRVPAGTELDLWDGRAFVSMVGFQFLDTRVLGIPIPFHRHFDEVNLRFYVRRRSPEGVRRGVVFVKEIVPRRAIAFIARLLYNENYVALSMRNEDTVAHDAKRGVRYEWRSDHRWNRLAVSVSGAPVFAPEDSEETFITEHYWGYVRERGGSTREYRVEHPRWRVWQADEASLECDVGPLYGPEFVAPLSAAPSSAFLAEGSPVTVRRGVTLR